RQCGRRPGTRAYIRPPAPGARPVSARQGTVGLPRSAMWRNASKLKGCLNVTPVSCDQPKTQGVVVMRNSMFAGAVMLLLGIVAVQSMRVDGASAPQSLTQVSPFELMQNARALPTERIDYPY